MSLEESIWKTRVYIGDTDQGGVVYYGKYLYWLEAARIEYLRELGVSYQDLQTQKIGLNVLHVDIKYRAPLRFDDKVSIMTQVQKVSKASLIMGSVISNDQHECAQAQVKLACINESTWKVQALPGHLYSLFKNEEIRT
ncbi:MAG: acyl-CoA thioesterase [Actinobacteria bacterium]|nr:acyl-CoA thioesterase [Actinomycetota bacterium]